MNEIESNQLLADVEGLVQEAKTRLQFTAGSPGTTVVAGFPFTLVAAKSEKTTERTQIDVLVKSRPYDLFKQGGKWCIRFYPMNHRTRVDGRLCYSDPLPHFTLPATGTRYFYLKMVFDVEVNQLCQVHEGVGYERYAVTSVTPRDETEIIMWDTSPGPSDDIPPTEYPCGGERPPSPFNGGGRQTLFFSIVKVTTSREDPPVASTSQESGEDWLRNTLTRAGVAAWVQHGFAVNDLSQMASDYVQMASP